MSERGKRAGQRLDNYQLLHLLGTGSFGEVYRAEHVHRRNIVAVKVLPQLADSDIAGFLNEARSIRLKHPHIVQVQDFGIEEHIPFIVMDYAPHGTLHQRHVRGSRVPLDVIVGYVKQTADALQYAHDERVIHRDVKPGNLLLGANYGVLVSDFGISTMAQSSRSQVIQKMAGTMAYMAPEQIQGKPRFASDQYALGIIVYEWLCGERPFSGTQMEVASQHMLAAPPPLREKMPDIATEVEQVVMVALAKDPKDRFGSIRAFATALEQAASEQRRKPYTVPATPVSPPPVAPVKPPMTPPSWSAESANPSLPVVSVKPPMTPPSWSAASANPPSLRVGPRSSQMVPQSAIAPSMTAPQSRTQRDRRIYPLLALLMVFLVVLLGSGGYYFLWQQQTEQDVENTLKVAKDTLQAANTAAAHGNPSDTLKKLAGAQQSLKRVANANLNTTQQQQLKRLLNDDLTVAVNKAIAQYNRQFAILALPCANSQATRLTNGTVNTQPGSVVAVRNGQKLFFYALGEDRHLYQLDRGQHTLGKEIALDKKALSMTTTSLAADDARVLVLTGEKTNDYSLQLLIPNANGDGGRIVTQSLSDWTKDGHKPMFLTTSGPDIYVVLTMEGVSTIMILDFTLEQDAFKAGPHIATISTSHTIVSAAALSHNRLFLLLNDGSVQSLQLVNGQQSLVFVNGPIATPLQNAGDFTANQTVPTPSSLVPTRTTGADAVLLSIPTAVFLAAGMFGNTEHLYVVDRSYHRVVDLVPDSTATNKTTTPTPVPTSDNAGGGIAKQVTMQLFQQYASPSLLAIVKSISADPTKSGFYLLAQTDQGQGNVLNLIPADTTQEGSC